MSYHDDLVVQAEHLTRVDRKGRPKQVNLRRALSSLYYALFHLLIAEAAGYWKLERHRIILSRVFDHGKMRGACSRCNTKNADLKTVARAFVELQQYRISADYDNATKWTRLEVRNHIKTTKKAFEAWNRIKNKPEAQDFLLSLLVPERK